MLEFKTPENISLKGLPKVYFCGTQKDYDNYYDFVTKSIWHSHPCGMFYNDEASHNLWEELHEMQMFIVIINREMLFDKTNIAWSELDYALKNGIAILPILESNDLAEEFNKTYNDVHCLNLTDLEMHSERLVSFLNAVLLRKEFSGIEKYLRAKFFLSYRKADSRLVRELMRKIHKNKKLLDVGFWYDEFLVPGEDFNNAINEELLECDAFVLTITDSIADKRILDDGTAVDNYVVKYEYRIAKENEKIIFPIDMVNIQEEKLSVFKELPKVLNAKDESVLWEAMEDYVKDLNQNNSPERDFYLGLAYLNGINMEVNRELAVELLSSSADNGVFKSICKLVDMYKNGIGVAVNREKAAYWQDKKVKWLLDFYRLHKGEAELCNLLNAYVELGDLYVDLNKKREAKNTFKSALEKGEIFKPQTINIVSRLATCHQRLGRIYLADDNRDKRGIKHMSKYIELRKTISNQTENSDPVWQADALMREANMMYESGNATNAIEIYQRAADLLEDNKQCERNPFALLCAAIIKSRMANIYQHMMGKFNDSQRCFEESLDMYKKLVAKDGSPEHRRGLAFAHNNLGNCLAISNDVENAMIHLQKSIEICEQLSKETDMAGIKIGLLKTYFNAVDTVGKLAFHFCDIDKEKCDKLIENGKEYLAKSEELLESIKPMTNKKEYNMLAAIKFRSLANFDVALSKIEGEIAILGDIPFVAFTGYYSQSIKLLSELVHQHYPEALIEYFRCVIQYTSALQDFKLYDYSKPVYIEAIDFLKKQAAEEKEFSENLFLFRWELMTVYRNKILMLDEHKEYTKEILTMFNSIPLKYQNSKEIAYRKKLTQDTLELLN